MALINYIKESFKELTEEVTWLPWIEAQKSTVVVAVFTLLFAVAVFLADTVFQTVVTKYFELF